MVIALLALTASMVGHEAAAQTPSPIAEWQYSAGVALRSMFEEKIPDWEVEIGVAADIYPVYPGAGKYRVQPGPNLDVRYKDQAFFSTGEGLGVNLLSEKTYRAGVALGFDTGREAHSATRLRGTGDIGYALTPKLFAEYVMFPVVLRADVRRALGGADGWIGDLSAYMPVYGTEKFFVFAGPTVTFADDTYNRHYFGISATQSQRSGLPLYKAGAGAQSAGFGSSMTWFVTDHWMVDGGVSAQRLLGDAAHSPLVQQRLQYEASFSIGYLF
ncbi:MAG TPA: MipA/OmpV family protein [Stellaceae bacterium]|nr:MipA/OmpV family protein [Stellaceae bacterium]